uniref:Uncharacterized protein n=1 Tax=Anguilla anguilla TaxID=7936 RepID=A0A0E9V2H2_ANGAN
MHILSILSHKAVVSLSWSRKYKTDLHR